MAKKSTKKPKPKPKVEEFLAAPDSVRLSEAERKKLVIRKAKLKAGEERILADKAKKPPSVEDLLADILRVAEDKETNPYWQFKSLSRKRYKLFGHFPIECIEQQFGQFEQAKRVAGLEDELGTRLKKAAIAESSRRLHAARYLDRFVMPYVQRASKRKRSGKEPEIVLSISDTHSTFLDPFTWFCFQSAIKDLKPDYIIFNGDILEGSEISRFPKIPGWTIPLQLEFDFARGMFEQARSLAPDAEIWWINGNHETDRLAMYLTQVAPAFAGLRSLRIDELLDLTDLNIKLAHGGTIASPKEQEYDSPGILLNGFYRIAHGTHLGKTPGQKELEEAGRSGQSGHVHRSSLVFGTSEADRMKSWMVTPKGCTDLAGRAYMKGLTNNWQTGFGVAFLFKDGVVRQHPVLTDDGVCFIEGFVYTKTKAARDQDPQTLWVNNIRL